MMLRAGLIALMLAGPAAAAGEPWDPAYEPPRMADGTPSLEGIWTNASITALERPDLVPTLEINEQTAAIMASFWQRIVDEGDQPTDPDAPAPEAGDGVGGYNTFWMDPGERVAMIDGKYRSSWIVSTADGKLPLTEKGVRLVRDRQGGTSFTNFDNPEVRSAGERCTVGFGSTGGPPMLNVLYNNHYQFVQTPETVAIRVEMNHNTRLIRIGGEFLPASMPKWLGDSIGGWDGDTLVVRSTNFHAANAFRPAIRHRIYLSPDAQVEERFTRVADDEIFYEFTVTDPEIYTEPWTGEMVLTRDDQPIYEYACHEGNYSLPGILAGARREEREAAAAAGNSAE
ncbi:MAG: hypothetical protein V2J26_04490 [Pacificimonas sp.]|jgi:hypothetical protein|nr:hypothetical protein [Pacificimonas sp.]